MIVCIYIFFKTKYKYCNQTSTVSGTCEEGRDQQVAPLHWIGLLLRLIRMHKQTEMKRDWTTHGLAC